jgi:hypothetical protein
MNIIGHWTKLNVDDCGKKYPDKIEFRKNGIYQAEASEKATMHPVWDAGTFELKNNAVKISTSNDAVINYTIAAQGETISFQDPDGCVVKYKKSTA